MQYIVDSINGNDTLPSGPFRSIQKAADLAIDGDRVTVLPGNYPERPVIQHANNVILEAKAAGVVTRGFQLVYDRITLDGFEIANPPGAGWSDRKSGTGVYLDSKNSLLKNLYIHDTPSAGVFCTKIGLGNVVQACRVAYAVECAIYADGQNVQFIGNDLSHTRSIGGSDADGVRFFGSGHVFSRNRVHDLQLSDSPGQSPHLDAFQTWGPAKDMTFERNWIDKSLTHQQGFTIEALNANVVANLTIRNNVFISRGTGYQPAINAGDLGLVSNVNVFNNTIVALSGGAEYALWLFKNLNGCIVKNNAVRGYDRVYKDDGATGLDISNNMLNTVLNNVLGFVNTSGLDFHLTPSSTLINAGVPVVGVDVDYDGVPRGAMPDIGAFEYVTAIPLPQPTPGPTLEERMARLEILMRWALRVDTMPAEVQQALAELGK